MRLRLGTLSLARRSGFPEGHLTMSGSGMARCSRAVARKPPRMTRSDAFSCCRRAACSTRLSLCANATAVAASTRADAEVRTGPDERHRRDRWRAARCRSRERCGTFGGENRAERAVTITKNASAGGRRRDEHGDGPHRVATQPSSPDRRDERTTVWGSVPTLYYTGTRSNTAEPVDVYELGSARERRPGGGAEL